MFQQGKTCFFSFCFVVFVFAFVWNNQNVFYLFQPDNMLLFYYMMIYWHYFYNAGFWIYQRIIIHLSEEFSGLLSMLFNANIGMIITVIIKINIVKVKNELYMPCIILNIVRYTDLLILSPTNRYHYKFLFYW